MLTPPGIYGVLLASRGIAPLAFMGAEYDKLALAVALALCQWGVGQQSNLALSGAASGLIGAGSISPPMSRLTVPPGVPLMMGGFAGAGLVGPLGTSLATALGIGIPQAFTTLGNYQGLAPTVGTGADVSQITTANAATLAGILTSCLTGQGIAGSAAAKFATGISVGTAAVLLTGTGSGPVMGASSPYPGAGPTNSVVV